MLCTNYAAVRSAAGFLPWLALAEPLQAVGAAVDVNVDGLLRTIFHDKPRGLGDNAPVRALSRTDPSSSGPKAFGIEPFDGDSVNSGAQPRGRKGGSCG